MWWPNKCAYVRCSDEAEQHDTRLANGQITHAMLNICVQGQVNEEAYERCF